MVGVVHAGSQRHNIFLGNTLSVQLAGNASFPHDVHAIAHTDDFRQFAGDHQDRYAFARHIVHDPVDLAFGTDVHAARGFIEDQNTWADRDPA